MNIAVAGIGYVGLPLAALLSQRHRVVAVDVRKEKVDAVNKRISPIADKDVQKLFSSAELQLTATTDAEAAFAGADFVIAAVPADYCAARGGFDTSAVESVVREVARVSPGAVTVIRSTVSVGYTGRLRRESGYGRILFSPEFLREGRTVTDNLYPGRIIVGWPKDDPAMRGEAERFAGLLTENAVRKDVPVFLPGLEEAEAIKLFSNAYLAMRVAYFNELDAFAEARGLDAGAVLKGVCLEPRIGDFYNNPSFGYGGYCLPKDTRGLLCQYSGVPQKLIGAIVDANETRKDYIADRVLARRPRVAGIYGLEMKAGAKDFRQPAVLDILDRLTAAGQETVIYEPLLDAPVFRGCRVLKSLEEFKKTAELILANRFAAELSDVAEKVYTRDLYARD